MSIPRIEHGRTEVQFVFSIWMTLCEMEGLITHKNETKGRGEFYQEKANVVASSCFQL